MVDRDPTIAQETTAAHPFVSTGLEKLKLRREATYKYTFLGMAIMLVVPVLAILSFLTIKAWPSLNWSFITELSLIHI